VSSAKKRPTLPDGEAELVVHHDRAWVDVSATAATTLDVREGDVVDAHLELVAVEGPTEIRTVAGIMGSCARQQRRVWLVELIDPETVVCLTLKRRRLT
jgi:hypothetical protein